MGLPAKKVSKFTYADYVTWDDNERWEIIHGEAFNMTPAPATVHQLTAGEIFGQIWSQLKGKRCKVFSAPFDVRLPIGDQKAEEVENVVQPDITVICDPGKLDKKGCLGTPDLVIEIVSPSTSRRDKMEKFFLYEQVGVKEYWLVYPDDKLVEVFSLGTDGRYGRPDIYSEKNAIKLKVLPDLTVDLNPVFGIEVG
jgi:Uma2 family endonuclease